MKTNKTLSISLLVTFLILSGTGTFAQEAIRQRQEMQHQQKEFNNQKKAVEAQKIAFISQELKLTPAEAKAFWPVYDEFDAKRRELRKMFRNASDLTKEEIELLTEQDAMQAIQNQLLEAQKLLDLRKEYNVKFKAVLPDKKILMLYNTERDFQKMLIEKLRQNRQNR